MNKKGKDMIRKLIYSSLFVFLIHTAGFAQFEDTTQMRDPQHISTAEQLTEDLSTRLALTDEQSEEIKEILIDYQENIAMNQKGIEEAEQGMDTQTDPEVSDPNVTDQDVITDTETQTDIETETDVETETDFPQTDIESETEVETETPTDYPTSETQTDVDAQTNTEFQDQMNNDPHEMVNQAIEDVLNDSQKVTWSVIKDAWWRDVNSRFGWDKQTE
jgi:hypothetical protein